MQATLNPICPYSPYPSTECPIGGPDHIYDPVERTCHTCSYSWPVESRIKSFLRRFF